MDTILFDLDGTLLPMDQDKFIECYFKGVATKLIPYGIEPRDLINAVGEGTKKMLSNDGTIYNYDRFWNKISDIMGEKIREFESVFMEYYKNEFQNVKDTTTPNSLSKKCINILKKKGYRLVLATNPLFPEIATYSRIYWAGLVPEDFEWITTYENSSYCKPNIEYYKEILNNIKASVNQCIMIGNDVSDDMVTKSIGMDVFLVTDCLININGDDIEKYRKGSFRNLIDFVKGLPDIN